jgi:outer membrane immunogenic protein
MKHVISATLVASALALGTTAASAADMPLKAPEIVPVFSWTGGYIGGNIGWIRGNADYDTVCPTLDPNCPLLIPFFAFNNVIPGIGPILTFVPNPFSTVPGGSASNNSFMGGGQIGYNYQSGVVVFGAEADLDATHIRTTLTRNVVPVGGGFPAGFFGNLAATSTFDSDWIGTVRGRLGLAWDRVMFYGTGGIAFAQTTENTTFAYTPPGNAIPAFTQAPPVGANTSQVIAGWTVGVGGEWFVGQRVSVGAEYRHSDFGHQNYTLGTDTLGNLVSTNIHYTTDQVTLRANWHFN